jgi:signal transduction histidine kinase
LAITGIGFNEELDMVKKSLEKEISETNAKIINDFSRANNIQTVKPYIGSILINLIGNAIKYRHPDRLPVIKLKTEIIDDYVCLTVQDNGLGIDLSQFRDKLFVLYNRFHLHVEGKGMGLYLVKTQVTSMGGKIEVESEPDLGTTFRVFFKRDPENGKAETK